MAKRRPRKDGKVGRAKIEKEVQRSGKAEEPYVSSMPYLCFGQTAQLLVTLL